VTPADFATTISSLIDPSFFAHPDSAAPYYLERMGSRWNKYIADGTFSLSVPQNTPFGGIGEASKLADFWTTPWPYWDMQSQAKDLWKWFQESGLVIFKGCTFFTFFAAALTK
jgi:hypothetical protein